jgi:prepilin-type N-terminal cleavage/methylation domain-containing protein
MKKEDLKKQHGFTMVELVIALTLLLLVALSFVPMFVYISEGSQNNRARLIALKLASSKIEEIRALPYDKIGTVGGDPAGVIPQEETKTIDNINFTIKTNIWWVDDPSDNDASGHDPLPYDYKRVKVAVESPSHVHR